MSTGGGGTRMCKKLKNFSCDGIKGLVRGNDTRKGFLFSKKKRPTGMPPPQRGRRTAKRATQQEEVL